MNSRKKIMTLPKIGNTCYDILHPGTGLFDKKHIDPGIA
jgi:hypothetical protein